MFIIVNGQTVNAQQLKRVVSTADAVKIVLEDEITRIDCPDVGKQVHDEINQALSKKTTVMIDIDALVAKAEPEPEEEVAEEAPTDTEAPTEDEEDTSEE